MKGRNTLVFCPATMHEALEYYLARELKEKVSVTKITKDDKGIGYDVSQFSVEIETTEKGEGPEAKP